MKKACKIMLCSVYVHLAIITAFSQSSSSPISAAKLVRLDSFMQTMVDNGFFNGTVVITQHGQVVYKRSAGYYNMERKIPNGMTTPFNLASLSKPFTSLAILQLVQQRKLGFDDAITSYLPDLPFTGVTVRQLLTHTSGLPQMEKVESQYVKHHPEEMISPAKAYRDLCFYRDSQTIRPGDRFQYNNTNYFLLTFIIEKVSGRSFVDYMTENIFQPAGMKNSFVRHEKANTPRYIRPTMFSSNFVAVDSLPMDYYTYYQLGGLPGANNVISTVEDLLRFDAALTSGKLVDTAILAKAFAAAILSNGKMVSLGGPRQYGMGWNIMDEPGRGKVVFHDGHIIGITTMLLKNLTKGQTIIYYDNTESPAFFQKVGTLSRILNDEPVSKISLKKSAVRAFGQTLVNKGWREGRRQFDALLADSNQYYFAELEMNTLGYDLLYHGTAPEHKSWSLELFKINMQLFPTHPNVYDSYGEALLQNGRKEEAITMYKKVLALDTTNESAKKTLAELLK